MSPTWWTGIVRLIDTAPVRPASPEDVPTGDSLSPRRALPHRGTSAIPDSVRLLDFIEAIEAATGREAEKNFMEMQPGDVPATWADARLLETLTGYAPQTPVAEGVARFVEWYRDYYRV